MWAFPQNHPEIVRCCSRCSLDTDPPPSAVLVHSAAWSWWPCWNCELYRSETLRRYACNPSSIIFHHLPSSSIIFPLYANSIQQCWDLRSSRLLPYHESYPLPMEATAPPSWLLRQPTSCATTSRRHNQLWNKNAWSDPGPIQHVSSSLVSSLVVLYCIFQSWQLKITSSKATDLHSALIPCRRATLPRLLLGSTAFATKWYLCIARVLSNLGISGKSQASFFKARRAGRWCLQHILARHSEPFALKPICPCETNRFESMWSDFAGGLISCISTNLLLFGHRMSQLEIRTTCTRPHKPLTTSWSPQDQSPEARPRDPESSRIQSPPTTRRPGNTLRKHPCVGCYSSFNQCLILIPVRTAQGGGGTFKDRKPIGEVGCCDAWMAEQSHWWIERWLERRPIYLSIYLPN